MLLARLLSPSPHHNRLNLPPSTPTPHLQDAIKLTQLLAGPLGKLQDAARRVAEVSNECKLEVESGAAVFIFLLLLFVEYSQCNLQRGGCAATGAR